MYSDGSYSTIEGNSNDAVSARRRSLSEGWSFVVPPDLGGVGSSSEVTMYAFERLDVKIYGGWGTKEARDGQMESFKNGRPEYWTRALKTTKPAPYSFEAGPPGTYGKPTKYGGWSSKETRDKQLEQFQAANPGIPTRTYNYKKTVAGAPPADATPITSGPDKTT